MGIDFGEREKQLGEGEVGGK